jgi:hypothetical protein
LVGESEIDCDVSSERTELSALERRMAWLYEPDETPKKKHHWAKDHAGFVEVGNVLVGKCPSEMTISEAQDLLNAGAGWTPRNWDEDYPKRIYTVKDGVVYRATPTRPGYSYHGFPEIRRQLPTDRSLHEAILALAREDGSEEEVRAWL